MFRAMAVAFAGFFGLTAYTHRHEIASTVQTVQQRVVGGNTGSASIGACRAH